MKMSKKGWQNRFLTEQKVSYDRAGKVQSNCKNCRAKGRMCSKKTQTIIYKILTSKNI